VRYWVLYRGGELRRDGGFSDSGKDGALGEVEPALRGGGLPLPGLKRWRLRRGLTQRDLALRAELSQDHLWKIESGGRGCNPSVAQHLAHLLKVDLLDLRRHYDDDAEEQQPALSRPARPRLAYRQVHQAYLKIFLLGAVGSAYAAMDEWAMEKYSEERSFEEVLKAVRSRKKEIEFLKGVLEDGEVLQDPNLPQEVRSFLEAVLKSYPDLDIRVLALARRGEPTEEGHEALTKAMRDLL
jgi:transcriptional regulator with XRE-family HTH domain